jgi:catechol 2,3-dioxygenase
MGVTTDESFGGGEGVQPAAPGSYGVAPRGYRLPDATTLGPVHLQVADLARSLAYYELLLGFRAASRTASHATLAPTGGGRTLIELHELPNAHPVPRRGRLGLYHFAILLPDRADLGRFMRHVTNHGLQPGAADHLVSEALYLTDPDGLGIEVYADRPRAHWNRLGRELMLATDPLDVDDLLRAAGSTTWAGMPAGTRMGHLHLHVGDLEQAAAFYGEAIGFDRITWRYPGALFLGAGGYHHHLGTNTWAGPGASPAAQDEARLLEWTLELPSAGDVHAMQSSLGIAGYRADSAGAEDFVVHDPWGTRLRVRAVAPAAPAW